MSFFPFLSDLINNFEYNCQINDYEYHFGFLGVNEYTEIPDYDPTNQLLCELPIYNVFLRSSLSFTTIKQQPMENNTSRSTPTANIDMNKPENKILLFDAKEEEKENKNISTHMVPIAQLDINTVAQSDNNTVAQSDNNTVAQSDNNTVDQSRNLATMACEEFLKLKNKHLYLEYFNHFILPFIFFKGKRCPMPRCIYFKKELSSIEKLFKHIYRRHIRYIIPCHICGKQ